MKKGMTLSTTVVAVAIMAILTAAALGIGINVHDSAKKTTFQSEINQIEMLVENYIKRNSGNNFQAYTWDLSNYMIEGTLQFAGETITEGKIEMHVVELDKIDVEDVKRGTLKDGATDRYLYSAKTGKVYYEKGIKFGGELYYRIDELEE